MRLIYSPAACSISTHIVLEEIGRPFETQEISARRGDAQSEWFRAINPKGKVPVLILDDGGIVTETPVILQYLARYHEEAKLLPSGAADALAALQICEYLSNTVHNYALTRLFRPQLFCSHEEHWEEVRTEGHKNLLDAFDIVAAGFQGGPLRFVDFSIVDASLFFFEIHAVRLGIPMPAALNIHLEAMLARPAVRRVVEREQLPWVSSAVATQ